MLDVVNKFGARPLIALLLAILFAQAVPSQPISLDRGRGPVFSAATAEVTLPPREDEAALVRTVSIPAPDKVLPVDNTPALKAARVAKLPQKTWPTNRQRGPPLKPPPRSIAAPREPPHLI